MNSSNIELAFKYLGPAELGPYIPKTYSESLSLLVSKISITIFRLYNYLFGDHQWHNNQSAFLLVKKYVEDDYIDSNLSQIKQLYTHLQDRSFSAPDDQKEKVSIKIRQSQFGDLAELDDDSLSLITELVPFSFNRLSTSFYKLVLQLPMNFNFKNKELSIDNFELILRKYSNIQSIYLPNNATDEYLKLIKTHCSHLKRLIIRNKEITDEGLGNISDLPTLEALDLSYNKQFTSEGLKHLTKLKLSTLNLYQCSRVAKQELKSIYQSKNVKKIISYEGLVVDDSYFKIFTRRIAF